MNMNPQYRAEIRLLKKQIKTARRAYLKAQRLLDTEGHQLLRQKDRNWRAWNRENDRIERRIAILDGRLS